MTDPTTPAAANAIAALHAHLQTRSRTPIDPNTITDRYTITPHRGGWLFTEHNPATNTQNTLHWIIVGNGIHGYMPHRTTLDDAYTIANRRNTSTPGQTPPR